MVDVIATQMMSLRAEILTLAYDDAPVNQPNAHKRDALQIWEINNPDYKHTEMILRENGMPWCLDTGDSKVW